jgi:hypothetical protein
MSWPDDETDLTEEQISAMLADSIEVPVEHYFVDTASTLVVNSSTGVWSGVVHDRMDLRWFTPAARAPGEPIQRRVTSGDLAAT